jgi:hypothetical protein
MPTYRTDPLDWIYGLLIASNGSGNNAVLDSIQELSFAWVHPWPAVTVRLTGVGE